MSSARKGADNQRRILRSICSGFQRALGLFSSLAKRRSACSTRLRLVVRLCSCSPVKEAEYFTTHRYPPPTTKVFSAPPPTPHSPPPQPSTPPTTPPPNPPRASTQSKSEIH